jgi:hypothetical protein
MSEPLPLPPYVTATLPAGHIVVDKTYVGDDEWLLHVCVYEALPANTNSGPKLSYLARVDARTGEITPATKYHDMQLDPYARMSSNRSSVVYAYNDPFRADVNAWVPTEDAPTLSTPVVSVAANADVSKLFVGNFSGLRVFSEVDGQWVEATPPITGSAVYRLSANHINNHIAIARASSPFLQVLDMSTLNVAFTAGGVACHAVAYSPDGAYLAVGFTSGSRFRIYKIDGFIYTELSTAGYTHPTGTVQDMAWSPDGKYIAVGHSTSPFMSIYELNRDTDTITKLANPTNLPTVTCTSVGFAPDGGAVLFGAGSSPFLFRYTYSGAGVFTRDTSLPVAVPGNITSIAFSADLGLVFLTSYMLETTLRDRRVVVWAYEGGGVFSDPRETLPRTVGSRVFSFWQYQIHCAYLLNGRLWLGSDASLAGQTLVAYRLVTHREEGVYRSTDKGSTWEHVFNPVVDDGFGWAYCNRQPISAFGDTAYLGVVADMQDDTTYGGYLYKSVDAGDTWFRIYTTEAAFPDPGLDGCDLTCVFTPDGEKVLLTAQVYTTPAADVAAVSLDGGDSWTPLRTLPEQAIYPEAAGYTAGVWFVGGFNAIRRSADDGATWTRVALPFNVFPYAMSGYSSHAVGVALPKGSTPPTGVLWSTDLGLTWAPAEKDFPLATVYTSPGYVEYGDNYWAYAVERTLVFTRLLGGTMPPIVVQLLDSTTVDLVTTSDYAVALRSILRSSSAARTFRQRALEILSRAQYTDRAIPALTAFLNSDTGVRDDISFYELVVLLSAVRVSAATKTNLHAAQQLLSVLSAWAGSSGADVSLAFSGCGVSTAFAEQLTRVAQMLDQLEARITASDSLHLGFLLLDELTASDAFPAHATLQAAVRDSLAGYVVFRYSGEVYSGWVMNLEGAMPVSRYEDYNFNSFCRVGSTYYGGADEGLFVLDGATDDGEPIDAAVATMMLDFGSPAQKRVHAAYIGYTSDGRVMLKVRAVNEGQLKEQWFEAKEVLAAAPREQMIRLGRGARSRYWQFELVNLDGADFELTDMEVHPVYLNRRV